MKIHASFIAVLAPVMLAGCACLPWTDAARSNGTAVLDRPAVQPVLEPRVTAEVMMRARIALPEDAELLAEVTDPATGAVIAESRSPLRGAQLPQAAEVSLPGGTSPGTAFDFRAAVSTGGKVAYLSERRRFGSGSGLVALGMVEVLAYTPLAFSTEYTCSGGQVAELGILDDQFVLRAGGQDRVVQEVPTASGAKYAAEGEPETSFWSKGEGGTLTLEGVTYGDCMKSGGYGHEAATPAARAPGLWRAQGNEPGWVLTMDGDVMALNYNYGAASYSAPEPAPQAVDGGMRWTNAEGTMIVTALDTVCADNMTGMPYPATVTVEFGEQVFRGCGGSPNSLLAGDWTVESINGEAVIAGSGASMTFDANAEQISGKGGCNTYGAPFLLTGETLTFGPARSTMMACADPLMDQERAMLNTLGEVSAFSIGEDGALTLSGPGGTITARR
jgi:heat shock protein HslJ/uncharacterized lipoprotein YbaY